MPAEAALTRLNAHADGLTDTEAAARLERFGPNRLPEAPRPGVFRRFLRQFHNILIYVLLASAAVTAMLGHFTDTFVILAVVVVNACIGFVQEGRAERAMDAIRDMLAPHASVLRDGKRRTVPGDAVVPGDIVLLEPGDRVPADLRLIEAHGLGIQEAVLTGESVPVEKLTTPVAEGAAIGDRSCLAFSGTTVTSGAARGVVVATGAGTEIGRISGLISTVETLATPLTRQLDEFARWLTVLILLVAGLLLVFGYFVEHIEFGELFMAVVGLSVAALPEGLPAVLTITLAVGVRKMAERNAIVRRLPAIETIGAVSVICTDKTGTLTRNEMTVASLVTAEGRFELHGDGYAPEGEVRHEGSDAPIDSPPPALREIARVASHCNDAALREATAGWQVEGDPMEGALLAMAERIVSGSHRDGTSPRRSALPFDARHRYMATHHRSEEGDELVAVKGAPEQVLALCVRERSADGGTRALDVAAWHRWADELASRGQRVLALAAMEERVQGSLAPEALRGRLVMLGLVGLVDPPRPEAVAAVAECQRAGIRVKMITGDHAGTAAAIGAQVGLAQPSPVLTGNDIDAMDDAALRVAVLETDVYARTSPEHKLRLVKALQAQGLTVAMTGDGVNDAPALKRADAGIAMGCKGSEAAKEAADLVLADDNFASIAAAVREGRTVHDNIRKVLTWTLPTNGGEALVIILALLAGLALPITPVQILWVNLITAATLGIALAFEPTEARTMERPPRRSDEPIISGDLIWQIALVSLLMMAGVFGVKAWGMDRGYPLELTRTMATNVLVAMEVAYLFFVRNRHGTSLTWQAFRGTPVVWTTILIVAVGQVALTWFPPMQAVFGTRAMSLLDVAVLFGIATALFALLESEKQLRLSLRQRR